MAAGRRRVAALCWPMAVCATAAVSLLATVKDISCGPRMMVIERFHCTSACRLRFSNTIQCIPVSGCGQWQPVVTSSVMNYLITTQISHCIVLALIPCG